MLVSPLRIFATLALISAAVGVSIEDIPFCVFTCLTNATMPTGPESGCTALHVLLSQTHWTSFPHSYFRF